MSTNTEIFFKKLLTKRKLIIFGRGPNSNYFDKKNHPNSLTVGMNIEAIQNLKVDFIYDTKKKFTKSKNLLNYDHILKLNSNFVLKVGSIDFSLKVFLDVIEKFLIRKKVNIELYLYGFDYKYSTRFDDIDFLKQGENIDQTIIDINSQLSAFNLIRHRYKYIKLFRAGFDMSSDFDPRAGKVENKIVSPEIVAEISTNHFGNSERLEELIYSAKRAKVNSIKLQMRDFKTFYSKKILNKTYHTPISKTFGEYREKLELSHDQIIFAKNLCKKLNMNIFFSVLDLPSFFRIQKYKFKRIKLPSTISRKREYLSYVSRNYNKNHEIVISTGMTNQNYVNFIFKKFLGFKKLYLMHCVSSYPASIEQLNMKILEKYVKYSLKFKNIIPGYSSHDQGAYGSIIATVFGAKIIEKHIKLGNNDWYHFDDTALQCGSELINFVSSIKRASVSLGSIKKRKIKFEHHKY